MKNILFFCSIILFIVPGCSHHNKQMSDEEAEILFHDAPREIDNLVNTYQIPRINLVYMRDTSRLGIIGAADSLFVNGVDSLFMNNVFQAASLSKVVFSYIVMKMVDNGEIDLDQPVCKYVDIDRFEDKEMASKITPRMVLSHTTGLYNWSESPSSPEWPTSIITFHYPVDSCFGYSGEGYAFLQRAVEAIRNKPLNEIAKEEVFDQFDLKMTSYEWIPAYDNCALDGFNAAGENRGRREDLKANCAYTLRTTATDYAKFLNKTIMTNSGLSSRTYKEWLTPRSHAIRFADNHRECDSTMYWCLGMGVYVDPSEKAKPHIYWHWGDNGSFKSLFVIDKQLKKFFVFFTNSANGDKVDDAICRIFFKRDFNIQEWIDEKDDE